MKKSFILYQTYGEQLDLLDYEQCGRLMKAIFAHECGGQLPTLDTVTKMLFSVIKGQLDRDRASYLDVCQKRASAGKKGAEVKAARAQLSILPDADLPVYASDEEEIPPMEEDAFAPSEEEVPPMEEEVPPMEEEVPSAEEEASCPGEGPADFSCQAKQANACDNENDNEDDNENENDKFSEKQLKKRVQSPLPTPRGVGADEGGRRGVTPPQSLTSFVPVSHAGRAPEWRGAKPREPFAKEDRKSPLPTPRGVGADEGGRRGVTPPQSRAGDFPPQSRQIPPQKGNSLTVKDIFFAQSSANSLPKSNSFAAKGEGKLGCFSSAYAKRGSGRRMTREEALDARAEREKFYSIRRWKAEDAAEEMLQRALKDPEYAAANAEVNRLMVESAKAEAFHSGDLPRLKAAYEEALKRRRAALSGLHLTEEDLKPHYACPHCSDTGFLPSGEMCRCDENSSRISFPCRLSHPRGGSGSSAFVAPRAALQT